MINVRLSITKTFVANSLACLIMIGAGVMMPLTVSAQTPEEVGLQIAKDSRERDQGFGNFNAQQKMILRNKHGQESLRQLRVKVLEDESDGNKTLFVFDEPRDVKGTAFLIHSFKDKADNQWIYLPALKRVKRISSSNRSGSFMGSEFAYEDMTPQEVEKYTYKYMGEQPCGEWTCTIVEQVPTDKKSGYRRQLFWRDKEELRIVKVEFFDRKNVHFKTLDLDDFQQYLDQYWRAGTMDMVNHVTGKSTTLTWSDYQFRTELNERDFTKTGLKRVR